MASIYKRGKVWWITYRVAGRNICHSLKTENARIAAEIRKKYEGLNANGLIPEESNTPIGPFLESLCEFWRRNKKPKGAETDIGRLRQFFGPCCPALALRPHTPGKFRRRKLDLPKVKDQTTARYVPIRKLEDVTAHMISERLRKRYVAGEIGGKTANHTRAVLSSMFTYAIRHHGYRCPDPRYKNPVEGVDRFTEVKPPIAWLTSEQIAEQLEALNEHPRLRALVAVYIYAGVRRSEGLWLTNADVDLDKMVIRVQAKHVDGHYWQPKTGRDRTIPISPKLLAELLRYSAPTGSVWCFPSPRGMRWRSDNFSDKLRTVNEAAGLGWSCGDYRHTFGSHLAMKGVSLYKISALMGNSPEICRKHYAALLPQEMRDEVEF